MRWKLAFISLSAFICISDAVATEKLCFEAYLISAVLDSSTERQSLLHILTNMAFFFLRKEVIQPHLPIRLPCYDFTPVIRPAFGGSFLR